MGVPVALILEFYPERVETKRGKRPKDSSRHRGRRKSKSAFEAGPVVHHLDASPMETGNGGHKAQPEPVARRVAAAFQPVKPLKHVRAFVVGNSGPIIDDRDHGAVVIASNLHGHATGFAAIFDRV